MSVTRMKKINICALRDNRKQILELLQNLGVIEINFNDKMPEGFERMNTATQISVFDRNITLAENAIGVFEEHVPEKTSMFASLEGKKDVSKDDLNDIIERQTDIMLQVGSVIKQGKDIEEMKLEISRCEDEIVAIEPWTSLNVAMNTRGTKTTDFVVGILSSPYTQEQLNSLVEEKEFPKECYVKVVSFDDYQTYITVLMDKKNSEEVMKKLHDLDFTRPTIITHHLPKESIKRRLKRIEDYNKQIEEITADLEKQKDLAITFKRISDYYRIRADKYRTLGRLDQTKHTFFISGSIPENRFNKVKEILESQFVVSVIGEEFKDEEAPVLLENGKFTGAVEGVVTSFGFPNRLEIDPTAITAFFYYFLFGIMLSDAGYGFIMFVACFLALKKFPNMEKSMAKSLRMFMYCGISTLIWGILFGGYFGDAISVISKTFFGKTVTIPPLWFEPIKKPMQMLIYCLIFGIIHLFTGLAIKGYMMLKQKDVAGFICDIILWYVMLIGLMLMLIPTDMFASLLGAKLVFPPAVNMAAKIMAGAGAVGILLTGGRGRKNPLKRLLLGAYSLYDVTSWLSDLLSYSRLLALGLATGVIAQVINTMASMGGKSIGGVIMFVLIFVIGHIFNMAVNLLGAYVHTNRLQFVEFFGKFYEGGGREFSPFMEKTKYIKIKNEE